MGGCKIGDVESVKLTFGIDMYIITAKLHICARSGRHWIWSNEPQRIYGDKGSIKGATHQDPKHGA